MAHNLIRISTDNEGGLQYRIGEKWIQELVSRAFLEIPRCTDDDSGIVLIPDLVYNILRHVSGGEFQTIDGNSGGLKLLPHHRHVRGFSTRLEQIDICNLRTVWIEKYPRELEFSSYFQSLAVPSGSSLRVLTIERVEPSNLDDCLAKAKLLRVLNISVRSGSRIRLPQSLFELYNLIHLNLSGNKIEELPESIGNLKNLRHLDLSDMGLKRMPDAIVGLTNLRSLRIKGNDRLAFTTRGLSRLKGLEELDSFVAPRLIIEAEGRLQELGDLVRHHPMDWPTFEINGLQNVKMGDAIKDDILLNVRCHDLSLYWDSTFVIKHSLPREEPEQEVVLNKLQPHSCIKQLRMEWYSGSNLPAWMGDKSLVNLVSVTLVHLDECTSISCLGKLSSLEKLYIDRMYWLREVASSSGSSPTDHHMLSFPKLTDLVIQYCTSITCIPLYRFPALTHFYIEYCCSLQIIEFNASQLECRPECGYTSSIGLIEIRECKEVQFPSEMAIPTTLNMLGIEKCEKLSEWVESNRSTLLKDVPEVRLDGNAISKTTEMEMMSRCSIADQMCKALYLAKRRKFLEDVGISKRKGMMVTDVGDPKGKKVLEDTGDTTSVDMQLFYKILEELQDVDRKSLVIKGMLDDAEERSGGLDVEWLRNLRSLAYMVEDLHDLFEYLQNATRVESNSVDQVNHSLADPRFWEDIENRIKEFKKRFESIAKEDTCLDKKEGFKKEILNSLVTNVSSLPPFEFIGRKEQYFDILVELLLMDQGNEVVEVIAIGGKAGVGKTAFAQLIFQHLKQLNHFDAMGWVYVSEHFDAEDILIAAERSFKKFFNRGGKKSFLVLDNIQYLHIWEVFLGLFISRYEGMGSKILITTREPSVPGWQGVANHMELPCLDEEEGWSLFERHAYSGVPDEEKPPGLIEIGKQIVKKCGYLPLSLKVLGCSFRYERCDEDTWRRVLEESSGDQWDLVQLEGGSREKILGPLYFCYLRLPSHLKACLRFCCLFHRGESIGRKDLIELWMAHNLIRISTDNEGTLQYRKGEEWIEELVSRAFLEIPRCTDDDSGIVLIPDLVYYILLRHASGGEFQTIDGNIGVLKLLPHHRHVRGFRTRLEQMDINNLRTVWIEKYPRELEYSSYFQSLAVSSGSSLRVLTIDGVEPTILDVWLAKAKLLRVLNISDRFGSRIWLPQSLFELYNLIHLNLSGYQIEELPESISNLKNLRHLDLSNTGLERMPWSLFELYNLIHLNLSGNKIGFLTKSIGNLKNLRHLDLSNTGLTSMPDSLFERYNLIHLNLSGNDIEKLPESIGNLKNLRHLDLSDMGLKRMPDAIVKLTNLRSFYIKGNDRLAFTPRGLFRLKGFEVLDSFVAPLLTIEGEQGLQELGDLERDHPIHSLIFEINGLQNVNKGDAIKDDILLNVHCHDLSLYWDAMYFFSHSSPRGEPEQEVVLNKLRPHSCIKQLRMERYKGCNLPAWMGDKSLVNLVSVTLVLLEECTSISCLGELPSLEKLYIMQMYWLREVASVVQSSSGSASTCHHILSFPKLTDLVIKYCRKITRIPLYRFPALTDLYISNCPSLEIVEFSGSLECPPEFGYTSSIGQIEIRECKEVQFRSEMAVLTSLRMLHIYDCEKLSAWVESNRSTLLKDVPEIKIGRPTF